MTQRGHGGNALRSVATPAGVLLMHKYGVSQRLRSTMLTWTVIGGAIILLIVGTGVLMAMPKLI